METWRHGGMKTWQRGCMGTSKRNDGKREAWRHGGKWKPKATQNKYDTPGRRRSKRNDGKREAWRHGGMDNKKGNEFDNTQIRRQFGSSFWLQHFDISQPFGMAPVIEVQSSPSSSPFNLSQELAGVVEPEMAKCPSAADKQISDIFKTLEDPGTASTAAPSSAAGSVPSSPCSTVDGNVELPPKHVHDALEQCGESGQFEMRGSPIGAHWSKSIIKDLKLREEYLAIQGEQKTKRQRDFREAWASKLWQKVKSSRVHTTLQEKKEESRATFVAVAKWLGEHGGGPAAAQGLANLHEWAKLNNAMHDTFRVSKKTRMLEVALDKDSRVESKGDQWAMSEESHGPVSGVPSPSSSATPGGASSAQTADEQKKGGQANNRKRDSGDSSAQPATKKVETSWADLAKRKKAFEAAFGLATTMTTKAEQESAKWLKSVPEFAKVTSEIGQVNVLLKAHPFWNDVQLLQVAELRKKYDEQHVLQELRERGQVVADHSKELHKMATILKGVLSARG